MNKLAIPLLIGALALASAAADAQAPVRVRGTVAALDGNVLSVKSHDGKNVPVQVAENTVIVFTQPIALADIRPGDLLAACRT